MVGPGRCGICDGDPERRRAVDRLIAAEVSAAAIERQLKAVGFVVKRETVQRHRQNCIGALVRPPEEVKLAAQAAATGTSTDFAALVRAEAVRKLNAGELKVTTQDGLQAQNLLDRREEKRKDRDLIVQLGKLLAGGGERPPDGIIEGEYEELDPPLLAAG